MGSSTLPLGGGDARRISETIIQTAHGFSPGETVRHNGTLFVLAQADTAANAETVGIVESVNVNDFVVVYQGRMDVSTLGYTPNEVLFLSDATAGLLTTTPPNVAGSVIKAMLLTGDAVDGFVTGYVGVQIGGDNTVTLEEIQPLGTILPWAAGAASPVPTGWALCNGQAISRTTYSDLFNLIGTDYGIGDGSTTFNVPDLQRRVPVGQDPGGPTFDPHGSASGAETHTLTLGEAPGHTHVHDVYASFDPGMPGVPVSYVTAPPPAGPPGPAPVGSVEGGGNPHNNLQPYLVVNFIIRTTQQARAALLDHVLDDHSDVDLTTVAPIVGDHLEYDGADWVPGAQPAMPSFAFRNAIENGQFDIWQRGTSLVGAPGHLADRWSNRNNSSASGAVFTEAAAQVVFAPGQVDVPEEPRFYIDFSQTAVGGDGTQLGGLVQRLENVRRFNNAPGGGGTVTLSFWAKGSIGGTIRANLGQFMGSAGSGGSFGIGDGAIVLTTSWQYYTLTFSVPPLSLGDVIAGGDDSFRVRFITIAGPINLIGMTPFSYAGTVSLANVQLEEGAVATPFEKRPLETEWGLCQRYYQQTYEESVVVTTPTRIGAFALDNFVVPIVPGPVDLSTEFPVRMRRIPTVSIFGPLTGALGAAETVDGPGLMPIAPVWISSSNFQFSYIFPGANRWSFHWTADAEL